MKLDCTPTLETQYLVIADYNLTRVEDVRMMTRYAREKYGLSSILIRAKPTAIDCEIADRVIDADPLSKNFMTTALEKLKPYARAIRAVFPFSDNAVQSGAALAAALGSKRDCPFLAESAFSKLSYRRNESLLKDLFLSQQVSVPRYFRIHSLEDLKRVASEFDKDFIVKPSCEGNNRGVIRITKGDDLSEVFEAISPYLEGGLICEEFITYDEEYSFDGIGPLHFMTEKHSVSGRYPVEKGQSVPARKSEEVLSLIERAGRLANLICGQCYGPFHNEIKINPLKLQAVVMEPNRRPAGMRIWHLAEKVYGLNFFHLWIDQIVGASLPSKIPEPVGSASIRMLPAPRSGRLELTPQQEKMILNKILSQLKIPGLDWFHFKITGQIFGSEIKDNSNFIGEVSVYSADASTNLQEVLDQFESIWLQTIDSFIQPRRNNNENSYITSNSIS